MVKVVMLAGLALQLLDLTNDKMGYKCIKDVPFDEQVPFWLGVGLFEKLELVLVEKSIYAKEFAFKLAERYQILQCF